MLTPPPVFLLVTCNDHKITTLRLGVTGSLIPNEIVTGATLRHTVALFVDIFISRRLLRIDPACSLRKALVPLFLGKSLRDSPLDKRCELIQDRIAATLLVGVFEYRLQFVLECVEEVTDTTGKIAEFVLVDPDRLGPN